MAQQSEETPVESTRAEYPKTRSFRCDDPAWEKGRVKARKDGYSASAVLLMLWEGYGNGKIQLPKLVYPSKPAPRTRKKAA